MWIRLPAPFIVESPSEKFAVKDTLAQLPCMVDRTTFEMCLGAL